jgi:YHS domain-containing protein
MESVNITSPADGFVITRNVSAGQRFEKGLELFRIADLRSVWILVDLFENEADLLAPGSPVCIRVPHQPKVLDAVASTALPQFDPTARTLKLRLEADNPDFILKPDMFVDIEVPVKHRDRIVVPVDAILDSGRRKTLFVSMSNGVFVPREVNTGSRLGEHVEITAGVLPGEQIAVSGTFLLDSESRMKLAAHEPKTPRQKDPVCHMEVDPQQALVVNRTSMHSGKTYYFCADVCKRRFDKNPVELLARTDSRSRHVANGSLPEMMQSATATLLSTNPAPSRD